MAKHEYLKVSVNIHSLDEVSSLMYNTLKEWWETSYLSDLNSDEMIPAVVEQWTSKHINTDSMKEAIQKIDNVGVPEGVEVRLVIELLTSDGFIKLEDEIDNVPLFRPYIKMPHESEFSLDTYIYDPVKKKFESLEIIDQETLVDEGVDAELINSFYSFHQRLMEASCRKIKLWTAQPEERISQWNKQGFIPKNSYLTDDVRRAEYYFDPSEHDVIVFYRVPKNQLLMTSDAFGAKEYVTLNDVKIE